MNIKDLDIGLQDRICGSKIYFCWDYVEFLFCGKKHRIGKPAVYKINGDQYWYQNDVFHRTNGPALIEDQGKVLRWFVEGKEYTKTQFDTKMKFVDLSDIDLEITNEDMELTIHFGAESIQFADKAGCVHRVGKPALYQRDSASPNLKIRKVYYHKGQIHRDNGPAVSLGDGTVEWWLFNKHIKDDELVPSFPKVFKDDTNDMQIMDIILEYRKKQAQLSTSKAQEIEALKKHDQLSNTQITTKDQEIEELKKQVSKLTEENATFNGIIKLLMGNIQQKYPNQ